MTTRGWRLGARGWALALAVVACLAPGFQAQAADVPELTEPVNDFAHIVDPVSGEKLATLSRTLKAATGDVVVVATIATVEPYADIREYAVKLFENHGRGIGDKGKDNGVLILVAVKERKVWVEVGYGLEQWITDGFAGETSREDMVPEFRTGRYGAGLVAGESRIVGRIAEGRNVTLTGVEVPRDRPSTGNGFPISAVVVFFIIILVLSRLSRGGPRRGGGSGILPWLLWSGIWSNWSSGVGGFRGGGFGGGGFGGGFGGFGGGGSGGGGGGGSW
jgi:uncharacterized protein